MQSTRKLFVGGNWKCNNTLEKSVSIVQTVLNKLKFNTAKLDVVVSPISIHLSAVKSAIENDVQVSAQNSSLTNQGAFTGEIAPDQIKDLGLNWVIIGHSERRQYYGEDNSVVAKKVKNALASGLSVIACIGEKLEEREAGVTFDIVKAQLEAIKAEVTNNDWQNIVIAYEPVWAIGTGKVATPEQAQEVHAYIRKFMGEITTADIASNVRVIYGGSVNGKNCADLIGKEDIDGFLVGGASLKPEFSDIVASCDSN